MCCRIPTALFITLIAAACVAAITSGTASAASNSAGIGVATASGHFTVERSRVYGNSTLFNGATIETADASSQLTLNNGAKLQLGAGSRARVYENKLVLERGVGQGVAGSKGFELEARGLRVTGESAESRWWVTFNGPKMVEVAALSGSVRVTDRAGTLLASLVPGGAMRFDPQAAGTAQSYAGCLVYKEGKYLLADESGDVIEVQGAGLRTQVGNRVKAGGTVNSGTPAIKLAKLILDVTSVETVAAGGCLTAAANLGAQTMAPANAPAGPTTEVAKTTAGGAKTAGGMSTGAKVGIAVAVIGGGAAGGLTALGGKKSTSP